MNSLENFIAQIGAEVSDYNFPKQPEGLYQPLEYFLKIGGKRLRPVLTLLGADVFGDEIKSALQPALGVELFHNFTLIHDDIMDEAPLRRGHETVHKKWNLNTAVLSGDVLFIDAFEKISAVEPKYLPQVLEVFITTARQVCEGQQRDMDFETMSEVEESEYIKMIQYKTSVLLGCALKIGAIISGAPNEDAQHLYNFGLSLGTSFQIKDDYLDAFGDPAKFGKKVGGDIEANKKTLLQIFASRKANSQQKEALKELQKQNGSKKVEAVKKLFIATGAKDYAFEQMEKYYENCLQHLNKVNVPVEKKQNLYAFAAWLKNRDM